LDSKQQKTMLRSVLALAVLAGSGWLIQSRVRAAGAPEKGAKDAAAMADRVVPVVAVPVVQRDMPIYLDGLGNVLASATVTVRAQVDGRLDRVAFKEGQEVHKGDLLAQIDPRPFENQLHTGEAALARDRAQLVGAQRNLARYLEMAKEGLAGTQQVDDQRVLVAQLEATTRSDQVLIDSARLQLDYARVTSPIDGVTGVRLVDQGNVVHPGDPTGLVMVTQVDPIAIMFTLPQDDLPRIAAQLAAGPVAVDAMSRDGSSKLASGQLALVDNQINQATATMRLKAVFPNPTHALWPNQFVKTRLLLTVRKAALVIPAAVVQRGPQGTFAYVVGPDSTALVKPITTEGTEGEFAVVTSGLTVGEQVVVDGQSQLRPGSKVSTRGADAAPGGSAAAGPPHEGGPPKDGKPHAHGAPSGSAK
jgi:multidrug efflux system membrane fusion protein